MRCPWRVTLVAVTAVTLAACNAQAPAPTGTTRPTAREHSGAGASTVPSAKPSADPATAAVKAFVAFASSPDASYQATFTGSSRHTVDVLPITKGVLQVSGQDVLVRATFAFPSGTKATVEHRSVGGKGWAREVPHAWQRLSGFGPAQSMAAFPAVRSLSDVSYLGPAGVAGKTLYKLHVASAILNPVLIPASNLTDVVVTDPNLTVLVDAAGRPVSGTAEIIGNGRVSGQLQEIAIDLEIAFSEVGQPVTITAP